MPWLAVEQFEYERVQDRAVLQLLATLRNEFTVPSGATLVVRNPGASSAQAPFASTCQAGACHGDSPSAFLWRASFAVSLEVVEYPHALFSLFADDRVPVALPAPVAIPIDPRAAALGPRLSGARVRRHLVALAAGFAVAAASGSGVGVASAATVIHPLPHRAAPTKPIVLHTSGSRRPGAAAKTGPKTNGPGTSSTHAGTTSTTRTAGTATPPPPARHHRPHPPAGQHPTNATAGKPSTLHCAAPPSATLTPGTAVKSCPTPAPAHPLARHHSHHHHHHHHHSSNTNATGSPDAKPGTSHRAVHNAHAGPSGGVAPAPAAAPPPPPIITPAPPAVESIVDPDDVTSTVTSQAPLGIAAQWPIGPNGVPFAAAELSQIIAQLPTDNQPPTFLIPIYKAAAKRYHIPWQILAAINWIETDYGANLNTSSAGATGWMQFMPGTWRQYGVAADGHGQPDPYSPQDAIFSAAHYLAANGAARNLPKAIFAYNHALWYVADVIWRAQIISDHSHQAAAAALRARAHTARASAGGSFPATGQTGLAGAETMLVAAYSAVGGPYSQANHDSFGQTAADLRRAGTDCSGFVSWVLDQVDPGFGNQTTVTLPDQPGIQPGPGQYVTMWDRPLPGNSGHVIINILGTWFESGGNTTYNPAGGIAPMSEAEAVGELTGGGFLPYHLKRL